ncbi:MAG: hypothetical protein COV76_04445 [Candidatus Omnitrophica bacterium CG11_big_fil_rev_8_21_14_0_20_64_10]|nr:MAG: hypothetical protein COV76_04445 [Candidatus Omnitrophica bacterium CG11_big_fil_rev_8_21_14_0_20_64_10]
MSHEHVVLCGSCSPPGSLSKSSKTFALALSEPHQNITLKVTDISRRLVAKLPPLFTDLLEIATYVFCADQAVTRGGDGTANVGADWRRQFRFVIPVRQPGFWKRAEVLEALSGTLGFLSEDNYEFTFQKLASPPEAESYFEFAQGEVGSFRAEEVCLFSGGLDSLAGALELIGQKKRVALVSHRSSPKTAGWQTALMKDLVELCPRPLKPFYIPVWVRKDEVLSREITQRSRSFLYVSLAATVAHMFKLNRVRFYENGVVSMNLPVSAQIIGARATRTTHPKTLRGFAELLSLITGRTFAVENPFLWKTKTDVVRIAQGLRPQLIKRTRSCSKTFQATKLNPHCGRCSQCIDRRFAVLAAGASKHDPQEMYAADLLTGERTDPKDVTLAESYARTAGEILTMSDEQFFSRFGEAAPAIRALEGSTDENARRLLDLHKRHAQEVTQVLTAAVKQRARDIVKRRLPPSCLLMLAGWPKKQQVETLVHSPDFRMVRHGETTWELSTNQARVTERLIKAMRDRTPVMSQAALLEELNISSERLRDVFKGSSAWNTLVVKGKTKGTYRINPKFSQ